MKTEEQLYMTEILSDALVLGKPETARFQVLETAFDMIKISNSSNEELLRITPSGEVIAPSLEAASEAGRVFVDSIRGHIKLKNNT